MRRTLTIGHEGRFDVGADVVRVPTSGNWGFWRGDGDVT
jgi:hypothetical protein